MIEVPAKYGFEAMNIPQYECELDEDKIKFILTEGELANEWIEISDIKMKDELDENGDGFVLFEFNSSLGSSNECDRCLDLLQIAQNLVKLAIVDIMDKFGNDNK